MNLLFYYVFFSELLSYLQVQKLPLGVAIIFVLLFIFYFSYHQVTKWWLMDQLAWALVLFVFVLLD